MKPSAATTMFHHRYYRYIRMMLRRYPHIRTERLAWCSGPGIDAICGNTVIWRLLEARLRIMERELP